MHIYHYRNYCGILVTLFCIISHPPPAFLSSLWFIILPLSDSHHFCEPRIKRWNWGRYMDSIWFTKMFSEFYFSLVKGNSSSSNFLGLWSSMPSFTQHASTVNHPEGDMFGCLTCLRSSWKFWMAIWEQMKRTLSMEMGEEVDQDHLDCCIRWYDLCIMVPGWFMSACHRFECLPAHVAARTVWKAAVKPFTNAQNA